MLLPDCSAADAVLFTERVRSALAQDATSGLPSVRVSAGILAAVAPASIETMLQGADSALYNAKRTGRDRTILLGQHDRAPEHAGR